MLFSRIIINYTFLPSATLSSHPPLPSHSTFPYYLLTPSLPPLHLLFTPHQPPHLPHPPSQFAATTTRAGVGIWDLETGRMKKILAYSMHSSIVSHVVLTVDGLKAISSESG